MVNLYFKNFQMHLKSELEYRKSFMMSFISQFGIFFTYYFLIIALFQKFSNINGFNVYEVLLCFSIIQFGFAFNEVFFRGLDKFDRFIINGTLDRILLRPQNILFSVLCDDMDISKISRILQSLIILLIALSHLSIKWNIIKLIILLLMLINAILIFFGLFVLMASYCFITVEALEVKNLFTDGGKHIAQYPIGIFKKGVMFIFTFIIPYASVNYYPLLYLLGKSTNIFYLFSLLLVPVFLIPCLYSFKIGLKHYSSTGS